VNVTQQPVPILLLLVAFAALSCSSGSGPDNPEVILATTTSIYDSGLLDVLIPEFEEKTRYQIKPIAVGTGRALAMGERGEADVLLAHAPSAEKLLLDSGAVVSRTLVMHNFFAIVGPESDLAGIKGMNSAAEALRQVAGRESLFISRGDDSGTHKMEKSLWAKAGVEPSGAWYQEAGQAMGATLGIASEKSGYTLTDLGTYLSLRKNLHLDPMVDTDSALLNVYSVLLVNADMYPKVNRDGAEAFADFLVAPDTQDRIGEFGVDRFGEPLFVPDAGKNEDQLAR
jgi:tungstate transport system substrate-binding protein